MTENFEEKIPMTCIICPLGCSMELTVLHKKNERELISVKDNNCPRGADYAKKELLNPTRTLTSTIKILNSSSPVISVKSDQEIPIEKIMSAMEIIKRCTVEAPVSIGDILIYDILGTGVNIIASSNAKADKK